MSKFDPFTGKGIVWRGSLYSRNWGVSHPKFLYIRSSLTCESSLDSPYDSETVSTPFHGQLPEGSSGDNLKLYTGGCHCGAVTLAVKLGPLSEVEIKEDNCSICQRVSIRLQVLSVLSELTKIECQCLHISSSRLCLHSGIRKHFRIPVSAQV